MRRRGGREGRRFAQAGRWLAGGLGLGFGVGAGAVLRAEVPGFDHAFPAGVTRGATAEVVLEKPAGPWPPSVWSSRTDVSVEAAPDRPGVLRVTAAEGAAPGIFTARLYGAEGVSPPLRLTVELAPSRGEDEEQERAGGGAGQLLEELPVVVDGRLDPGGDVDRFGIRLEAGEWLAAEVVAHALGSPVDPLLHLRGPEGTVVAFRHDDTGLDPAIGWRAERGGVHVLEVSAFADPPQANIRLAGGKNCVYRLRVSRGPAFRAAEPLGVRAGALNRLRWSGWGGPENGEWSAEIAVPNDGVDFSRPWVISLPGSVFPASLPVGRGMELVEADVATQGTETILELPVQVTGVLAAEREEDRYRFRATEGRVLRFGLWSARGRLPVDGVLAVRDAEGKELASKDALGEERGDPELVWTAPATGDYLLAVWDLMRRGGEDFRYRVSLEEDRPGCRVQAKAETLALPAGGFAEWEFSSERRQGYGAAVEAVFAGLPGGVSAAATAVPEGGGDFKIRIEASPETSAGTWPVRLQLGSPVSEQGERGEAERDLSGVLGLWITVQPSAPAS